MENVPENPYPDASSNELLVNWKHRFRGVCPVVTNSITASNHNRTILEINFLDSKISTHSK